MTSNYKFATHAYTIENYDLTHEQVHKMKDAIDNNYKNGGGFGYICIPKPSSKDAQSNFEVSTKVECAPVFVDKGLIPKDKTTQIALNVKNYQGDDYLVLASSKTKPAQTDIDSFHNTLKLT